MEVSVIQTGLIAATVKKPSEVKSELDVVSEEMWFPNIQKSVHIKSNRFQS